jgi:hypothetical protein
MIPQLQTRPHPNGDCVRACIASLLELPIAEVPDWLAMRQDDDGEGYPTWYIEMQHWLYERGLAFVEVQLERKTWMPLPFPTWAIFIGPDPATGNRHAIVGQCIDGRFAPVHDPMGGDPAQSLLNGSVEAVCFLVPIDPAATRFKSADVKAAMRRARASDAQK